MNYQDASVEELLENLLVVWREGSLLPEDEIDAMETEVNHVLSIEDEEKQKIELQTLIKKMRDLHNLARVDALFDFGNEQ